MKQRSVLSATILSEKRILLYIFLCSFVQAASSSSTDKAPLYIGGMFSLSGAWDGSGCLVAAELALEMINNRSDILPDYDLKMVWNDTMCHKSRAPRVLYNLLTEDPTKLILLGPACSPGAALTAPTASYWNLITVLNSATAVSLSDRNVYRSIYRTAPTNQDTYNDPVIYLMKKYGWRRIAYIQDSGDTFHSRQRDFMTRVAALNGTVVAEYITDKATNQIERLRNEEVRILLVTPFEEGARLIFCEAYKQGFYGPDIFWIIPSWYTLNWWLVEDDVSGCTTEEISEIVETSLAIAIDVAAISKLNVTTVAGITPAEFLNEVKERLKWPKYQSYSLNNYLAYTFDAVWSIGLMLNRTANKLTERKSTKRLEDFTYTDNAIYQLFFDIMADTDFQGTSGRMKFLNGEREGSSDISQLRGHCKDGWHLNDRFCFKYCNEVKANWFQAVTFCEEEDAALAVLVSDRDITTLFDVWKATKLNRTSQWNVGLRQVVGDNSSEWSLVDLTNRSSSLSVSGDSSHECAFIDFADNNSLKTGHCREERAFICKYKAKFSLVPIAVYSSPEDEIIWLDEIIWPGGNVTLDGPISVPIITERIEKLIPAYLHVLITSAASLGVILDISLALFIGLSARRRGLHAANSFINYVIALNGLLIFVAVILFKSELVPDLNDEEYLIICQVRNTATSVGFMLGVSSIVGEIWLIYKAATKTGFGDLESNMWRFYAVIVVFLTADIILIITMNLLYPQKVKEVPLPSEKQTPNHIVEYYVTVCSSEDYLIPFILVFGDKVMVVFVGLYLTYEVKQASVIQLKDTKRIAICIYNITLFGACGLILVVLLKDDPSLNFIFSSILIICCTTVTILIFFISKTTSLIRKSDEDDSRDERSKGSNSTESTVKQRTNFSSLNLRLRTNIPKELLEENERLKKEYEELKMQATRKSTEPSNLSKSEDETGAKMKPVSMATSVSVIN